jgi:hypothetical protein
MKTIQGLVVSAVLAIGMAAPASAGINDPEVIIYRFPGVRDDGGAASTGVATTFQCTNFSGQLESVRFATRGGGGALATNFTAFVDHLATVTASTHPVIGFSQLNLGTGSVAGGTTAVAATSINIICTAMAVDAGNPKPAGLALRGIRFNPAPGSQE